MSIVGKVTYPKSLKEEACAKNHGLLTIDYDGTGFPKGGVSWRGGMTMQGPMSPSKARMVLDFIKKIKESQ